MRSNCDTSIDSSTSALSITAYMRLKALISISATMSVASHSKWASPPARARYATRRNALVTGSYPRSPVHVQSIRMASAYMARASSKSAPLPLSLRLELGTLGDAATSSPRVDASSRGSSARVVASASSRDRSRAPDSRFFPTARRASAATATHAASAHVETTTRASADADVVAPRVIVDRRAMTSARTPRRDADDARTRRRRLARAKRREDVSRARQDATRVER